MFVLLIYDCATGVYSSRLTEAATYVSIAFRYIAANVQPDYASLSTFRKRFLKEIEVLFVQVLCIARQMKLLKLGALAGTKIHANVSRHSALSYGQKIEAQFEAEMKGIFRARRGRRSAAAARGLEHPGATRAAKAQIEACAAERDACEKADFDAKIKAREETTSRTGRKPGGKPPMPPSPAVRPTDQINLTDADSRIMPATGRGAPPKKPEKLS